MTDLREDMTSGIPEYVLTPVAGRCKRNRGIREPSEALTSPHHVTFMPATSDYTARSATIGDRGRCPSRRARRPLMPSCGRRILPGSAWASGRVGSVPRVWVVESLFQAIAMAKRLYVGNLSYSVTSEDLQEMFEQYGQVRSAQVLIDRETGRSRGFGFVEMDDDAEAEAAIEALDGNDHDGRRLTVNEARPREPRAAAAARRGGAGAAAWLRWRVAAAVAAEAIDNAPSGNPPRGSSLRTREIS